MKKFSLIELLVVVAIIGILVSLLAPSLKQQETKQEPQFARAVSSNRVRSLYMYIEDNNDYMPYNFRDNKDHEWTEILWPYIYPNDNWNNQDASYPGTIFYCPSPDPETNDIRYGNNSNIRDEDAKISTFSNPSEGAWNADSTSVNLNVNKIYFLRHETRANTLFIDGHVEGVNLGSVPLNDNSHVYWQGN